jgi:c-ets proto-oncogene protein
LDLLLSPEKKHLIDWTGNGYEFRILQPEEIAKLWGARKNKPRMNYDKLSRGLRYYYSKGIMDKVQGKKLTFKYTCDVQNYVRSRHSQNSATARGGGGGGGGVVEYHSGSGGENLVPVTTDGRSIVVDGMPQPQQQEEDAEEEGGQSERSYSDLDLMAGFQSAVKKASEISGMVGVVSQGFANPIQGGGGLTSEDDPITTSAPELVGICTEAV